MKPLSENMYYGVVFFTMLLVLAFLPGRWAVAATIQVDVDRNPVEANESFAINFTANDAVDGQPDFRPLEENFKIISRNQSSNIQIIDGRMSRQTQWSLYVIPKRAGKLTIPSIAFGDDKSTPLQVTVNTAKAQPEDKSKSILFLENEVDKSSVYVQAQLIYTVRIYQAVNLLNASLSELSISDSDAIVEKIGEDKTYSKTINGRRFKVFEKRYLVFPQKSGTLTINPAELEAQYVDDRRALRTKLLRSEAINVEVKSKPMVQTVQNSVWLPAGQMQIKEEWPQEPPVFNVGEPVTRTITVVAAGLPSAQLPEIDMGPLKDMKHYLDQPLKEDKTSDEGIIGMRQEKIALIPTKEGKFVIPAVEIPWWNTEKDRLEYLRLPAREISVNPASQTAQADVGKRVEPEITTAPAVEEAVENVATPTPETLTQPQIIGVSKFWMWVSLVAIAGWLVTALAWWWSGRARVGSTVIQSDDLDALPLLRLDERPYVQMLQKACELSDAQAAKNALLNWGKVLWPEDHPGNLNELSRVTGGPLGAQLLMLNTYLYSNKNAPWNATNLWQAFTRFEKPSDSAEPLEGELLPLYKTTA